MQKDLVTSLLSAGPVDDPGPTPMCPDEHLVAGYVDGRLSVDERRPVEAHLADCTHCLALVGLLSHERDQDAEVPTTVPRYERGPAAGKWRRPWPIAPQWAAAAALVLAVPLLLQTGRNTDRGAEGQGRPLPAATRALAPSEGTLQVLAPQAGSAVDVRNLAIRWAEVAGSPYYDVRIVTDAGDVVARQRVVGTSWRPPPSLLLRPGAEYYVHIDAYPSGDKAMSSDHVPFRVAR